VSYDYSKSEPDRHVHMSLNVFVDFRIDEKREGYAENGSFQNDEETGGFESMRA
jgi:hypothetical protein